MNNTTLIQLGSFKDMVAAAANPLGSGVREAFVAFQAGKFDLIAMAHVETGGFVEFVAQALQHGRNEGA